jgi:hypothetical protein
MSIVECVIAVEPSIGRTEIGNSTGSPYFLIALATIVMVLVVLIFIRTSAGRSSKR